MAISRVVIALLDFFWRLDHHLVWRFAVSSSDGLENSSPQREALKAFA
jgi:hypothetical protein